MPYRAPPLKCPGAVSTLTVAQGTGWFRIHRTGDKSCEPKYFSSNPFLGGRFDSLRSASGHVYCAATDCAAIYETVLRDRPFDVDGSPRVIERSRVALLSIATVEVARDLKLVRLFDLEDLAAVGQEDEWLLTCGSDHYAATRSWAETIRTWVPDADGIAWKPRFGRPATAIVVYENLVGSPSTFTEQSTVDLYVTARAALDRCLDLRAATVM